MIQQNWARRWAFLVLSILAVAFAPQGSFAAGYVQHNLASDIPLLADYTDPNLVDPWGLALAPFWPCNHGSATYTVQAVDGAPTATVTIVPTAPGKTGKGKCTGAVRNNNAAAFRVDANTAGTWLLDTEDGLLTIRAGTQNIIKVDNSASGAVYKGLALKNSSPTSPGDFAYAANFSSGAIEVYNGNWERIPLASSTFTDSQVPEGFAPFNIQNIGGKLYVAYARQNAAKTDDVGGPGNGYVAVFDTDGNLLQHLISGGPLNSPWGLAIAPSTFGDLKGALLVGNFRDGIINAFDVSTGQFIGPVLDPTGKPIVNVGLWALVFGTGGNGGDPTKLYFTAGISFQGSGIQTHGLFGTISVAPAVSAAPSVTGIANAANYGNVAPGAIAAIVGSNLTDGSSCGIDASCGLTLDNHKRVRNFLAGAQVSFNGGPATGFQAPIFYATPGQLAIQVPFEVTGPTATLQVTVNGQSSAPRTVTIDPISPALFTTNFQISGPGVITHNDGKIVDASNPAAPGEVVTVYANGLGPVTPEVPTGAAPTGVTAAVTKPTVTIDGMAADVQFYGISGCCAGLNQINVAVPSNVRTGTNVNVVMTQSGKQSNTVTLATKAAAGASTPAPPPPPNAPPPPPAPVNPYTGY